MASAGTLYYDLVPRFDASRLIADARRVGNQAGSSLTDEMNRQLGRVRLGGSTRQLEDDIDRTRGRVGVATGAIGSMLGNLAAMAAAQLGSIAVSAVSTGFQFASLKENATIAFTTMMRDGSKAQAFVQQLADFAKKTPFEFAGLLQSSQRLMAFGFTAEQVIPTMTAIGDAVAGLGGSTEQLNRVTTALGQIMAKGKVQSDEILQLTEAGIPALRILANQMGVTTGELQKMITKGLVTADQAIPMLLSGIEKGTKGAAGETAAFGGMMAQQATTLTGVWSNFKDSFQQTMGSLVAPILPLVKSGMLAFTTILMEVPNQLAGMGAAFAPVLEWVRKIGADLAVAFGPSVELLIKPLAQAVGVLLYGAFQALGAVLGVVGAAIGAVTGWMREHQFIVTVLVGALIGMGIAFAVNNAWIIAWNANMLISRGIMAVVTVAQWAWNAAVSANPIGLLIIAISALVAGLIYAWNNSETFRNVVTTAWERIKATALTTWESLKTIFAALVTAAQTVAGWFVTGWGAIVTAFNAVRDAAVWFWERGVKPAFDGLVTGAKTLVAILFTVLVAPFLILWNLLAEPVAHFVNVVWLPAWDQIKTAAVNVWVGIQVAWAAVTGWIQTYLITPLNNFWVWVQGLWATFLAANNALWLAVQMVWAMVVTWVTTYLITPLNNFWIWVQSIFAIFQAANAALWAAIVAVWTQITTWIDTYITQPFLYLWNGVIAPVWAGIQSTIETAWNYIRDNIFTPLGTFVSVTIPGWFSAAAAGIKSTWDTIREACAAPVRWVIDTVWNNGIVRAWNAIAGAIGLGSLPTVAIGFARGGVAPGRDRGYDYVPALLRGGEGVLVPEATRMLGGAPGIHAINRHAERAGYATGGVVGVQHFQAGGIASIFGSVASGLQAFLGGWDPAAFVRDKFSGLIDAISGALGGNFYAQQIGAVGRKAIDAAINTLIDKVTSWWNSLAGFFQSMLAPAPLLGGGGGGNLAAQAARIGLTGNAARDWIIAHESGGRNVPNASGASTASGYFQMINGTWRAYGGTTGRAMDASYAEQERVATNYVNSRYGGWGGAVAYWQSHGNYDQGGVLPPGWTMAYNGTGKPELILNHDQAARMAAAGGSLIGSLAIQVPESATAKDVVDEISFALRHARHGGLHARRYG